MKILHIYQNQSVINSFSKQKDATGQNRRHQDKNKREANVRLICIYFVIC